LTAIQPGTYEQDNSNIYYSGDWGTTIYPGFSNGSASTSYTPGSYYTFKFNGTGIALYGLQNSNCSIAKITLDDIASTFDSYSSDIVTNEAFFQKTGLTPGEHTIKVEVTENKNSSSSNLYQALDSFDIRL